MKVDLTDAEIRLITRALSANTGATAGSVIAKLNPVECSVCSRPLPSAGRLSTHLVLSHHWTAERAQEAGVRARRGQLSVTR